MTVAPPRSDLIAVVPVRAGSKGLPGKNTRRLAGLPLYQYAVRQALRTVGRVVISTDIEEIMQSELPANCYVCARPAELAADETPMAPVLGHLIDELNLHASTLVLLQATSPLRKDIDVEAAIALHATGSHDLVMSVIERDRGVLKYGTLENGEFKALRNPSHSFQNRQALPRVYGPNGAAYVFSAAKFMLRRDFPVDRIGAVEMPADRSIDIDTEQDFQQVENLIVARRALSERAEN